MASSGLFEQSAFAVRTKAIARNAAARLRQTPWREIRDAE